MNTRMEEIRGQGLWEGVRSFLVLSGAPLSQYLQVVSKPHTLGIL